MPNEPPRLYLITPPVANAAAFAPRLEAALSACPIACVLLRTDGADAAANGTILRALAPLAQNRGVAVLVPQDAQLAIRANADGCHVEGTGEALRTALKALQPGRIVGAGGLFSRDAAITAGEAGVDYLMFGGPGGAAPNAAIVERVKWWAEIFNVPCVAYANALPDAAALAEAGADFIALGAAVFSDPRGPAAALAEVVSDLAKTRENAR